jgi:signal peptide peptidase SppA
MEASSDADGGDVDIRRAGPGAMLFQIASRVLGRPLLLHPGKAEVLLHVLEGRIPLGNAELAPLGPEASRFVGSRKRADGSARMNPAKDGVAVITIVGSLVNRGAWIGASSGMTSYEGISAQIRDAVDDPSVQTILLDIDSPGGEATGMFATAQVVAAANRVKPVIAFVNDMAASAAYGIASAAREIIVSPTSIVGSIGVVLTHLDRSGEMEKKGVKATLIHAGAHKVDGHAFGPLSDSVTADLQAEVGKFYDQFVSLVAQGRGARLPKANARATEARTYIGADAVKEGLADRVASLDDVFAEFAKPAQAASTSRKGHTMTNQTIAPAAEASGFTQAQLDAARIEGAAAERARMTSILTHAEATGREAQAIIFACEPAVTAEAAGRVLATIPKATVIAAAPSIPSISARDAALGSFGAGAGDPNAGGQAAAVNDLWAKTTAKTNARMGAKA